MAIFAIILNTIYRHFYKLIHRLEFELAGDIILHELLRFILSVIGGAFNVYAISKMFPDKENRAPFLFLIPERCQPSGINECSLLGKIVAEIS